MQVICQLDPRNHTGRYLKKFQRLRMKSKSVDKLLARWKSYLVVPGDITMYRERLLGRLIVGEAHSLWYGFFHQRALRIENFTT